MVKRLRSRKFTKRKRLRTKKQKVYSVLGVFLSNAKVKNRDKFNCKTNLTLAYMYNVYKKQKGRDPYLNTELIINPRYHREEQDKKWIPNAISIDRIDSSKPYMKGNIQFITTKLNIIKQNLQNSDLFGLCKTLSKNEFPYYGRLKHILDV